MKIVLQWPHKHLSPNARKHWRTTSKLKAAAREDARKLTFDAMQKHLRTKAHFKGERKIPYRVSFYPPDRHRRDDDNMIASFKAARDGVSDGLGVDDRRFEAHYFFGDAVPGGKVIVEIGVPK